MAQPMLMEPGDLRQFRDVSGSSPPRNHWVSGRCFMVIGLSSLDPPLPVYRDANTVVDFLIEGGELVRDWGYLWVLNNSEALDAAR